MVFCAVEGDGEKSNSDGSWQMTIQYVNVRGTDVRLFPATDQYLLSTHQNQGTKNL